MKLGPTVLLEIVDIIRDGFARGADVSQRLRDIDVVQDGSGTLALSPEYLATRQEPSDDEG